MVQEFQLSFELATTATHGGDSDRLNLLIFAESLERSNPNGGSFAGATELFESPVRWLSVMGPAKKGEYGGPTEDQLVAALKLVTTQALSDLSVFAGYETTLMTVKARFQLKDPATGRPLPGQGPALYGNTFGRYELHYSENRGCIPGLGRTQPALSAFLSLSPRSQKRCPPPFNGWKTTCRSGSHPIIGLAGN
jgi:hypothetical protein